MDSRMRGAGGAPASVPPRASTINDVARVAGVSRQTVTRALNDMPDVSAATRERVIAAARVVNYRPNRAAQGLVRGREVTVGLVVTICGTRTIPELASELTPQGGFARMEHGALRPRRRTGGCTPAA